MVKHRRKLYDSFLNAYNLKTNNDPDLKFCLELSLEHIEVFLVIFSETSEGGHVGFPENWVI